jgi:hypothetical protein
MFDRILKINKEVFTSIEEVSYENWRVDNLINKIKL